MLRNLVAVVLIAHGLGHTMGFLAAWTNVPVGFTEQPWLLPGDFAIDSAVGRAFGLLWLVAMVGTVGAGMGLIGRQPGWPQLAVAASVISLVAILPWWGTVTPGSRLWAALFDVAVIVALAFPWGERVAAALR